MRLKDVFTIYEYGTVRQKFHTVLSYEACDERLTYTVEATKDS